MPVIVQLEELLACKVCTRFLETIFREVPAFAQTIPPIFVTVELEVVLRLYTKLFSIVLTPVDDAFDKIPITAALAPEPVCVIELDVKLETILLAMTAGVAPGICIPTKMPVLAVRLDTVFPINLWVNEAFEFRLMIPKMPFGVFCDILFGVFGLPKILFSKMKKPVDPE